VRRCPEFSVKTSSRVTRVDAVLFLYGSIRVHKDCCWLCFEYNETASGPLERIPSVTRKQTIPPDHNTTQLLPRPRIPKEKTKPRQPLTEKAENFRSVKNKQDPQLSATRLRESHPLCRRHHLLARMTSASQCSSSPHAKAQKAETTS